MMTAEPARASGSRRWLRCHPHTCRARSSPKSNTSHLRGREETAVEVVPDNWAETLTLGAQVSSGTPVDTGRNQSPPPTPWGPTRPPCFLLPSPVCPFFHSHRPITIPVPDLALPWALPSLSPTIHGISLTHTHTHTHTHTILNLPVLPPKPFHILPHLSISTAISLMPTPFSLGHTNSQPANWAAHYPLSSSKSIEIISDDCTPNQDIPLL